MGSWLSQKEWEYDFNAVVSIAGLVYGFLGSVPVAIWFLFRQLETSTSLVTVLCVYGYSLTVFIPITFVCLLPMSFISWLALAGAASASALFLVRNYGPVILQYAPGQATLLVTAIGLVPFIFMFCIKLTFY